MGYNEYDNVSGETFKIVVCSGNERKSTRVTVFSYRRINVKERVVFAMSKYSYIMSKPLLRGYPTFHLHVLPFNYYKQIQYYVQPKISPSPRERAHLNIKVMRPIIPLLSLMGRDLRLVNKLSCQPHNSHLSITHSSIYRQLGTS